MYYPIEAMASIDFEAYLLLKDLRAFLLSDELVEASTDRIVISVADIIESNTTNLNVLTHCALSLCHFRELLAKHQEQDNISASADFSLAYISFKKYLNKLSECQNRTALLVILENQSLPQSAA